VKNLVSKFAFQVQVHNLQRYTAVQDYALALAAEAAAAASKHGGGGGGTRASVAASSAVSATSVGLCRLNQVDP
jgi:hypothetical protein